MLWCSHCQTSTVKRGDRVCMRCRCFHLSQRERAAGSIGPMSIIHSGCRVMKWASYASQSHPVSAGTRSAGKRQRPRVCPWTVAQRANARLMGLKLKASCSSRYADADSSVGRVVQLLKLKLLGSTGFEVCTLFIQIPINALEVGDFLFDFCHLLFN
ncbi:hypothetical protein D3C81_928340 [compost metagenome]